MTNGGPTIVIEGTFEFAPGDARTFRPHPPERDRERQAFWFCAEIVRAGARRPGQEVRFRITPEAIERMPERRPATRGVRLAELLIAWLQEHPDNELAENVNDFQVFSAADETTIEPLHRPAREARDELERR